MAASRSLRLEKPHRPLAKKVFAVPVVESRNSSVSVGAATRLARKANRAAALAVWF